MKELDDIRTQLRAFSSKFGPETILTARVTKINENDTIAIEFSDESTVDDCRLKAIVKDGNKVILVPKVGSVVLVGRIETGDDFMVISVDEITRVIYKIDNVTYTLDENGLLLQKGADTLLQGLLLLIDGVQQILVLQGNNPDYVKIAQAKQIISTVLQ